MKPEAKQSDWAEDNGVVIYSVFSDVSWADLPVCLQT